MYICVSSLKNESLDEERTTAYTRGQRIYAMKSWIAVAMLALVTSLSANAHVQWESDGLANVMPPKYNPGVSDPDRGVDMLKERQVELRGLSMDFKRIDHVEIQVFNNTPNVPQTEAWVEVDDIRVVSGFAKVTRGKGLRNFYVQGNGPIVLDVITRVSNKTDSNALDVKISSPYR